MPGKVLIALLLALAGAFAVPGAAQAIEVDGPAAATDEGQNATFVVRQAPVIMPIEVTVEVVTDQGATPGADTGEPSPKTFTLESNLAGDTQEVVVPVTADGIDEGAESFTLRATGSDGTSDTASGGINDRDETIDVSGATVAEGGAATITLTPRAASPHPVRVDYGTLGGTAGGQDFTAAAGSVEWPAGDASPRTFQVQTTPDETDEDDEAFGVLFASSGASGASLSAPAVAVTITDDDAPTLVGAVSARVDEGDTGSKTLNILVALARESAKTVRVTYRTRSESATSPADYGAVSGVLTFAPGETVKAVPITIRGDRDDEPDETFELGLEAPENATIASSTRAATITIADNEGAPGGLNPGPNGDDRGPRVRLTRIRLSGNRLAMSVRCPAAETRCRSTISVFNIPNRRSAVTQLRRERRLARGRFTLRGGQTRRITIRLSAANRRLLRQARRVRVRAFAVTTDAAGNVGNASRSATLTSRN